MNSAHDAFASPDFPAPDLAAMGMDTRAVHAAAERARAAGGHVPTIDLSTTFALPDVQTGGDAYEQLAGGGVEEGASSYVYQRLWQANGRDFELGLAALENTPDAVCYASGMAALSAALLASVLAGKPHVVGVRPIYGGTDHLLATQMLGTTVTWAEPEEVAAAVREDTGLVVMESPANPTLELFDIKAVVAAAGDVPVLVDNTFATPVLQRPYELGAALVVHSATKYLGGHGDAMGGIVACDADWARRLRGIRAMTGALLHPFAAYLLARGLRTLPVRMRHQQQSAATVAEALTANPAVSRVFYPGLPGQDPQGLLGTQFDGPGAMLAIELTGGFAAASRFVENCRLAVHAVSLGGVDTLVQHPASLTHRPVAPEARPAAAVVRISVGLEDPADILADFEAALAAG